MKQRQLFCEISPFTYRLSTYKCCLLRCLKDGLSQERFCRVRSQELLPVIVHAHRSLIRRTLGEVDAVLQENKAVNLSIAAPKVTNILIRPGETFSFWKLVGSCTAAKGYKTGLTISNGKASEGIGGGMCQFTNLIHWLVLHTPMEITEHHHHNGLDLFPDFGRQVPFGTGTSTLYNYLDYRFKNITQQTFQLVIYTTDTHLVGEIRSDRPLPMKYHIKAEDEFFSREEDAVYRNGRVIRECVDKQTGKLLSSELIMTNHAKVLYDSSALEVVEM